MVFTTITGHQGLILAKYTIVLQLWRHIIIIISYFSASSFRYSWLPWLLKSGRYGGCYDYSWRSHANMLIF